MRSLRRKHKFYNSLSDEQKARFNALQPPPQPIGIETDGAPAPDANQGETVNLRPNSGLSITPAMQRYAVRLSAVIDDQLLRCWGLPLTLPGNWVLTRMMEVASMAAQSGERL